MHYRVGGEASQAPPARRGSVACEQEPGGLMRPGVGIAGRDAAARCIAGRPGVEVTGPYGTLREWSVLPTKGGNPCPPTCPA